MNRTDLIDSDFSDEDDMTFSDAITTVAARNGWDVEVKEYTLEPHRRHLYPLWLCAGVKLIFTRGPWTVVVELFDRMGRDYVGFDAVNTRDWVFRGDRSSDFPKLETLLDFLTA